MVPATPLAVPPRAPRRGVRAALLALVLAAGGAGAVSGQGLPGADPAALGFDSVRLERAHALLAHLIEADSLAGAVLMVARRGRVATARAHGLADRERGVPMRLDHIFRLASQSKVLVSAAAMTLYEEDAFFLTDPVARFVPELGELHVFGPGGEVVPAEREPTLRDLFRHTCGFGYGYEPRLREAYRREGIVRPGERLDWTHPWTLDEWVRHLARVPMAEEPARYFNYGLCHDVLGLVLERVGGARLDALLQERVFDPLGMKSAGFWYADARADRLANVYDVSSGAPVLIDDVATTPYRERPRALSGGGGWDSPVAYGGIAASAPDMLRFGQALLNGGELEGRRILGRQTAELFFRNHLAGLEREDGFEPGVGFGLGTAVLADPDRYGEVGSRGTMWWAGSVTTFFWVDPVEELVGILMTQTRPFDVAGVMGRVQRLVYTALVGEE